MKFRYKARTKEGELQLGFVEGANRNNATATLQSHGLFVLSVEDAEQRRWYDHVIDYFERVKAKDMMIFSRQFATMLAAKVPLNDALKTIQAQTSNPTLRGIIGEVSRDVDAGLSLSQAMGKHPQAFSSFYVNMIRSAEVTGRVEEAAGFMADYIERQAELLSRVKGALIYPATMIVLFIVVAGIIATVVLPQIAPIFEEAGVEVPFFTKILLIGGSFLAAWWWLVAFGLLFIAFVIYDYFRTPEGRVVLDEIVLRFPGFSKLLKQMHIARLSESLAVLMRGAIPIAQAVEITGQTVGSPAYADILNQAASDIRSGELLSESIAKNPEYFPPFVSQMIAIGEKTGRLEEMLERVSIFYTREVNTLINGLVELVQPVMMVFIGVLVGGLFASILVPIYNLVQTF